MVNPLSPDRQKDKIVEFEMNTWRRNELRMRLILRLKSLVREGRSVEFDDGIWGIVSQAELAGSELK